MLLQYNITIAVIVGIRIFTLSQLQNKTKKKLFVYKPDLSLRFFLFLYFACILRLFIF